MLSPELKQTGETVVLRLEGECTLEHAVELHSALVDALERASKVVLHLGGATAVDLSCLQLICSAHRTVIGSPKRLALDSDQSEAFKKTVREAGYYRTVGCHGDPGKECLWIGGR